MLVDTFSSSDSLTSHLSFGPDQLNIEWSTKVRLILSRRVSRPGLAISEADFRPSLFPFQSRFSASSTPTPNLPPSSRNPTSESSPSTPILRTLSTRSGSSNDLPSSSTPSLLSSLFLPSLLPLLHRSTTFPSRFHRPQERRDQASTERPAFRNGRRCGGFGIQSRWGW